MNDPSHNTGGSGGGLATDKTLVDFVFVRIRLEMIIRPTTRPHLKNTFTNFSKTSC